MAQLTFCKTLYEKKGKAGLMNKKHRHKTKWPSAFTESNLQQGKKMRRLMLMLGSELELELLIFTLLTSRTEIL